MPADYREWYQVGLDDIIYRQPYNDPQFDDALHRILYDSQLHNQSQTLTMIGYFDEQTDDELEFASNFYFPVHINDWNFDTVFWGRNDTATIQIGYRGQGATTYYLDLRTRESTLIRGALADQLYDRIFAISDDGNYVAYSSSVFISDTDLPVGQSLYIWQAPYHDDACSCTYDAQIVDMIAPINQNAPNEILFAGVGFVNENTILYIGESGLMRHNLLTGISTPLDRELNVGWIRTAVFSPDLEHVAITTEEGLYILETFAP